MKNPRIVSVVPEELNGVLSNGLCAARFDFGTNRVAFKRAFTGVFVDTSRAWARKAHFYIRNGITFFADFASGAFQIPANQEFAGRVARK